MNTTHPHKAARPLGTGLGGRARGRAPRPRAAGRAPGAPAVPECAPVSEGASGSAPELEGRATTGHAPETRTHWGPEIARVDALGRF